MKTSNRQQWVDTAKGVCILLVILYHIIEHFKPNTQLTQFDSFLYSIRMPLYYTIAGLFVVVHNIKGFLQKKLNRLIIPYIFFILLGDLCSYLLNILFGYDFVYYSPLYFCMFEGNHWQFINIPIWFLLSLFETYILFIFIDIITKMFNSTGMKIIVKICLSLIMGICGFSCHRLGVDLPCFFDTSLTSMPFLIFGNIIYCHTKLFQININRTWLFFISLSLIIIGLCFSKGTINFYANIIKMPFFNFYFVSFSGVLGILMLSKFFGTLPIITKIGRYSIVYLGTHNLYIQCIKEIMLSHSHFEFNNFNIVIVFIIVTLLSSLTCWIFLKTVPCLIAQKDIIYIGNVEKFQQR